MVVSGERDVKKNKLKGLKRVQDGGVSRHCPALRQRNEDAAY